MIISPCRIMRHTTTCRRSIYEVWRLIAADLNGTREKGSNLIDGTYDLSAPRRQQG